MPVVLKTAAGLLGMPSGPARAPALPLDQQTREKLAIALEVYRDWRVEATAPLHKGGVA